MELKSLPHFFNNKVYVVPDYQRGYSWEPKHVTDLLTDIDNATRLNKPHYMGTISPFFRRRQNSRWSKQL